MLLSHIVRFAVPCFLMLSGAFILADERNADYKYFYKKSFRNIGITSIIFCLLYVLFRMAKLGLSVFIIHKHSVDTVFPRLFAIVKDLIKGKPYYHLWYLFVLLGLYIAAPFVIRLASDLKRGGKPVWQNYNRISCHFERMLHNKHAYVGVGHWQPIMFFIFVFNGLQD